MGLRVVLVEDNPDHAVLAKRSLERSDEIDSVEVCRDATHALEFLHDESRVPPDVVVTDIWLPGMTGVELVERMQSERRLRDVPVVLVSASAREADVQAGLRKGAWGYLAKPIRAKELVTRVRRPRETREPISS